MRFLVQKVFLILLLLAARELYAQQEVVWRETKYHSFVINKLNECRDMFLSPMIRKSCQRVHFIGGANVATLMETPKGMRPQPKEYLCPKYIATHLGIFRNGASYIVPKDILDKYGRELVGRPDNCQFIIPKEQMDCILEQAAGDVSKIEAALGVPSGRWAGRELSRIDILCPEDFHLRIPTGNEEGVNDLWIPGGYLWQGYREAIISQIPQGAYVETKIKTNDK